MTASTVSTSTVSNSRVVMLVVVVLIATAAEINLYLHAIKDYAT
jgi:hypothetical protein